MASSLILQGGSATQNSIKESVKQNTHGFSVGNSFCPWEDEGTVEFLWKKGEENGNLIVLNNTDSTILCTASSNIGSFSEVKVKPQTKYFTKASHCSVPIGLLTFRESI